MVQSIVVALVTSSSPCFLTRGEADIICVWVFCSVFFVLVIKDDPNDVTNLSALSQRATGSALLGSFETHPINEY